MYNRRMSPSSLPDISFVAVVRVCFGVMMVLTGLISAAFYYHWGRFAPSHAGAIATMTVYSVGLFALILALLGVISTM